MSAKKLYIKVMSVKHQDFLFSAKYDINTLGYKMYVSKSEKWYRVYAGTFTDRKEANKALKKIKKYISKNAFIVDLEIKDNDVISENKITQVEYKEKIKKKLHKSIQKDQKPYKSTEKYKKAFETEQIPDTIKINSTKKRIDIVKENKSTHYSKKEKTNNNFYIGLTSGLSKLGINSSASGTTPISIILKESAINYGIEIGYNFNNNIFSSLNYQYTDSEDISFHYLFTSLNYKFDEILSTYPYIGILAGYSQMSWKDIPINSLQGTSSAYSFLGGVQLGSEILINDNIAIYTFYRYLKRKYTTKINTDTSNLQLEHNDEHNLNIGIKYNF